MQIKWLLVIIFLLMLSGCATLPPPDNTHNICSIFDQYPDWRIATQKTAQRWRVPVGVQMAIMYQESSFVSTAKPPRRKLLGFIPWKRPTTAYGYCQAVNPTWDLYQRSTGNYGTQRHEFAHASEFIGWYASRAERRAGIPPNNAYDLYLAYHEGITNYMNKTYLKKTWLMRVAKKVQFRAKRYERQLWNCSF